MFVIYEIHKEKSVGRSLIPRNLSPRAAMIGNKHIPEHMAVECLQGFFRTILIFKVMKMFSHQSNSELVQTYLN